MEAAFRFNGLGACVLMFDGRVLELVRDMGEGWRIHPSLVRIADIVGPDRKGRTDVTFRSKDTDVVVHRLLVDEENLARIRPLLDAFVTASAP